MQAQQVESVKNIMKERIWINRVAQRDLVFSICIQILNRYGERFIVEKFPMIRVNWKTSPR